MPAAQADRVGRLKILAGAGGRWLREDIETSWHDTAEFGLAGRGLALSRTGAAWAMSRLAPGGQSWPPARAAPVLAEGDDPAAFGVDPAPPPVAILSGTRRTRVLADGIKIMLITGQLRGGIRDHPVCRLSLAGAGDAVAALATGLTHSLDLAAAPGTLTAQALALARGTPMARQPPAAPDLDPAMPVEAAFALMLGHLGTVILHWAPLVAPGPDHDPMEAVHQMRVAVRRLRSVLSIFARAVGCPAITALGGQLKHLGAVLGPARDWDVFVSETGAGAVAAMPGEASLAALMAAAARRQAACHEALRRHLDSRAFRRLGIEFATLPVARPWRSGADEARIAALDETVPIHAAAVLRRRSKKLRGHGASIDRLPAPELHAIRLQAKRLRYATEAFQGLFAAAQTRRFLRRLAKLQQCLGGLNDGDVAAALTAEIAADITPEAAGLMRGFTAGRATGRRRAIAAAWKKFRKHQPFL